MSLKSKALSTEKLTAPFTTDSCFSARIKWYEDSKFCLIFKGSCLKQKNATYTPKSRINFLLFMN